MFRGHTAAVLDTDWSPFNDNIIASGSDDGKVFLWTVPEDFTLYTDAEEPADVSPVGKLSGHSRKVGHVLFNPAAENVLASSSGDYTVKLWDLEDGKPKLTLKHNDIVQSLSWSADGSTLVTTSRDKKLRFWDARQEKPAYEVPSHTGAKNSRVAWMGEVDRVVTTGFSRTSERQIGLWDPRSPTHPLLMDTLDSSSGVGMPFWDDGCHMLYLAGKGDGNIKYFEFENDKFEPLSEYRASDAQRGLAFMPKRGVNTHENEVMRAFKTVNDQWIEPISFIVPRRSEMFQDDIYPPTLGLKPASSSSEWFAGHTGVPPKFSMEAMFEGQEPKEVAVVPLPKPTTTTSAPTPTPAPTPVSRPADPKPEPTPAPAPAPVARELPSVKEHQRSMSTMADKFADKDAAEDDDDDDASSFEEVQKPVERPSVVAATRQEIKTGASDIKPKDAPLPFKTPAIDASSAAASGGENIDSSSAISVPASELRQKEEKSAESTPAAVAPTSAVASAAGGLREVLQEIRTMIHAQGQKIEELTSEVAQLKAKVT